MKVWLVCFLGLFGAVELYQWVAAVPWLQMDFPTPILLGGGSVLAIGSNIRKANLRKPVALPAPSPTAAIQPAPPSEPAALHPSPQLPVFDVNLQPRRSISFIVRRPSPPPE